MDLSRFPTIDGKPYTRISEQEFDLRYDYSVHNPDDFFTGSFNEKERYYRFLDSIDFKEIAEEEEYQEQRRKMYEISERKHKWNKRIKWFKKLILNLITLNSRI